jgi:hypothetical protein
MARRRYILCSSCGTFLKARDTHCPGCGAWTAKAKREILGWGASILVALLGALYLYSTAVGLAPTFVPH